MLVPTSSKVVLAGYSHRVGEDTLYMERQLAVTQSLTLVGMTSSDLCFWLWWRLRGRNCLEHDRFTTGVFVSDANPMLTGTSANFLYNTGTGVSV